MCWPAVIYENVIKYNDALAKGPSDHFSFIIFGTISAVDFVIYIVQNVESLKNTSK